MPKTTIKRVPRALRAIQNTPQFIRAESDKKKKEEKKRKEMVRIPREVWLNCEKFIKNASDRIKELEKEIAKREEDFNARLIAVYREIANQIHERYQS